MQPDNSGDTSENSLVKKSGDSTQVAQVDLTSQGQNSQVNNAPDAKAEAERKIAAALKKARVEADSAMANMVVVKESVAKVNQTGTNYQQALAKEKSARVAYAAADYATAAAQFGESQALFATAAKEKPALVAVSGKTPAKKKTISPVAKKTPPPTAKKQQPAETKTPPKASSESKKKDAKPNPLRDLIVSYIGAIEAKNFDALRKIDPNLDGAYWQQLFSTSEKVAADVDVINVKQKEENIYLGLLLKLDYQNQKQQNQHSETKYIWVLEKDRGKWYIVDSKQVD